MNIGAPTQIIYFIALIIALVGVLAALGVITFVPLAAVWIMTIAYVILAVACVVRGA